MPTAPFDFSPHPYFARLRAMDVPGQPQTGTLLAGYLGGIEAHVVKVHSTLEDPLEYLEVAEADVLFVAPAPEEVLPSGGSYLWVKEDAQLRIHRSASVEVEARYLTGAIADEHLRPPDGGGGGDYPRPTTATTTRCFIRTAFCVSRCCVPRPY